MSTNMFLKLDSIEGESSAAGHEKEIEILSWSHGFSQPTSSVRASSGSTVEKVNHSDITITKYLDSATDDILKMCWTGKQIKTAVITCLRSDGAVDNKYVVYLKIEMDEIIISSYSISGGGGDLPVENVSLNYGKIKYTYMPQKQAQPISYDLLTNKVA
jgi:type VI secretion system secreted protein Hcp